MFVIILPHVALYFIYYFFPVLVLLLMFLTSLSFSSCYSSDSLFIFPLLHVLLVFLIVLTYRLYWLSIHSLQINNNDGQCSLDSGEKQGEPGHLASCSHWGQYKYSSQWFEWVKRQKWCGSHLQMNGKEKPEKKPVLMASLQQRSTEEKIKMFVKGHRPPGPLRS